MALNEADTRAKLIDPAIRTRGWTEDLIQREVTAGSIEILGGKARRQKHGRADYTLRVRVTGHVQPVTVALIEAKAETLPPNHGLEQGKAYADAKRLNVPFVFSSNGHLFVEYDIFTGYTTQPRPLTEFPTPSELQARYEVGKGFLLSNAAALPLLTPYSSGESSRRYYQDAAVRAVLEKIARGDNRALLSLATGAGKTRLAVALLKRIADAGQLARALFLCDRDELRTQGAGAFHAVFGADSAVVTSSNAQLNAKVLIATYQTLGVDTDEADASFLMRNYPPGFFSHIIVDECHRSAWGKWSQVLTRNANAVQIGLTATPRLLVTDESSAEAENDQQISADNHRYFGEPVYEYDLVQGIRDGYLAACEIIKRKIWHDDKAVHEGETVVAKHDLNGKTLRDAITGEQLTVSAAKQHYDAGSIERALLMPERVQAMAADLFGQLQEKGGVPEQKTIIFCASDNHADNVANALNNLYAAWCKLSGKSPVDYFAFKCTRASGGGDFLPDFRGSAYSHFIATTVELLTTGVDIPALQNVVFFRYVKSPISFHQMVGRGTRLDPASNKLMFRVYDYTDATRLFGSAFRTRLSAVTTPRMDAQKNSDEETVRSPIIEVEGVKVRVTDAGRYIVTSRDGKVTPVTVEEYRTELATRLLAEFPTLELFRKAWVTPSERQELLAHLVGDGYSPRLLQTVADMADYDLYDVLADAAYGMAPRTRDARADAFGFKHADWLQNMPKQAEKVLRALVRQFVMGGTEELETREVFRTQAVRAAGGINALQQAGSPADLLSETKEKMFAA